MTGGPEWLLAWKTAPVAAWFVALFAAERFHPKDRRAAADAGKPRPAPAGGVAVPAGWRAIVVPVTTRAMA